MSKFTVVLFVNDSRISTALYDQLGGGENEEHDGLIIVETHNGQSTTSLFPLPIDTMTRLCTSVGDMISATSSRHHHREKISNDDKELSNLIKDGIIPNVGERTTFNRLCMPVGNATIISLKNYTRRLVILPYLFDLEDGECVKKSVRGTRNLFLTFAALLGMCKQWNRNILRTETRKNATNLIKRVGFQVPDCPKGTDPNEWARQIALAYLSIVTNPKEQRQRRRSNKKKKSTGWAKKGIFEGELKLKKRKDNEGRGRIPYYICPTKSCPQRRLYKNYEFQNLFDERYVTCDG